ncbi:uncharacterized protein LOC110858529 [Folsomia candida]|uniref:uncharacterized protein LOC110858529 n=1 Tax=Folsomia candida TaxID=158441 RepID=UPI001604B147|nr:uncharacterized protein LOC110858529 [Folsomia candida]
MEKYYRLFCFEYLRRHSVSLIIKMGVFFVFLALGCCWGAVPEVGAAVDPEGNKNPSSAHDEISVSYSIPTVEEHIRSLNIVVDMTSFKNCDISECSNVCGTKDSKKAYCDPYNKKLCMCDPQNFHPSDMVGTIDAVNREIPPQKNCSVACNKRNSYGRIWMKEEKSLWSCLCLLRQLTPTGITLCDPLAKPKMEVCRAVCQTDTASCSFNGACVCRKTWDIFFNMSVSNVRKEIPQDQSECSTICTSYHHDYVGRIYDSKMGAMENGTGYALREKYCVCGDWLDIAKLPQTTALLNQGFQLCTGLKCKQRCGMDEAVCEPHFRRGCLCPRENIIIGKHLWARLPTPKETKCYETCSAFGFDARVIEWNPFLVPQDLKFEPHYPNRHAPISSLY